MIVDAAGTQCSGMSSVSVPVVGHTEEGSWGSAASRVPVGAALLLTHCVPHTHWRCRQQRNYCRRHRSLPDMWRHVAPCPSSSAVTSASYFCCSATYKLFSTILHNLTDEVKKLETKITPGPLLSLYQKRPELCHLSESCVLIQWNIVKLFLNLPMGTFCKFPCNIDQICASINKIRQG